MEHRRPGHVPGLLLCFGRLAEWAEAASCAEVGEVEEVEEVRGLREVSRKADNLRRAGLIAQPRKLPECGRLATVSSL